MNNETFEEIRVPIDDVDNKAFLVEGQNVKLLKFKDNVIGNLYLS
jgi:translation elongation factor P/translation initiation factor 5A